MGEVVNVVVAFAVIVLIVRWAIKPGTGGGNAEASRVQRLLGFRPRSVSEDMISTVQQMFPDVPRDNIHYDLLRTGSVEATSNKLLETGFLEVPPRAYFLVFPTQAAAPGAPAVPSSARQAGAAAAATSTSGPPKANLIARFQLEERLRDGAGAAASAVDPGGKASWEDTAERREASLRERKAQMVLAARKRLLEQQQQQGAGASTL
ncbi:hypothetical protein BU17DRAFT_73498 [Hysterangium stoloniferum]|nr:hypothetical protein BU17DRAFT_73498 [Hysterangium stoloniferum]